MKKTSKILVALFIMLMIVSVSVMSFAATTSEIINDLKQDGTVDTSGIIGLGKNVTTIIRTAGTIIAVVILLILGIKYMMGSAQEKAEYKKTMIPYIIGAILIFAASYIATMIVGFAGSLG